MYHITAPQDNGGFLGGISGGFDNGVSLANALQQMMMERRLAPLKQAMMLMQGQQLQSEVNKNNAMSGLDAARQSALQNAPAKQQPINSILSIGPNGLPLNSSGGTPNPTSLPPLPLTSQQIANIQAKVSGGLGNPIAGQTAQIPNQSSQMQMPGQQAAQMQQAPQTQPLSQQGAQQAAAGYAASPVGATSRSVGTWVNPDTGEALSVAAPGQRSRIQNMVRAKQMLVQGIPDLINAGNTGITGAPGYLDQSLGSLLGKGSLNNVADYNAKLNYLSDVYLSSKGMPVTDQSIQIAKNILGRGLGESTSNYTQRLMQEFNTTNSQIGDMNDVLRVGGVKIPGQSQASQGAQQMMPQTSPQGAAPTSAPIQIPTFNSRDDFRSWYAGLPPGQKQAVKARLSS
jgi:hypothetical protein